MSDKRTERGDEVTDRLSQRFGDASEPDPAADEDKSTKTAKPSQSSKSNKTTTMETSDDNATDTAAGDTGAIKDRPSVLMYLPEDLKHELDLRFDELNLKHKREHGEPLEKNRDFYPAVIEAALDGTEIQDVLDNHD